MKTSTAATGAVVLFLLLSSATEPIDALSQSPSVGSWPAEHPTLKDKLVQPDADIQDKTIDQIGKVWTSLLAVDNTVNSFILKSNLKDEIISSMDDVFYDDYLDIGLQEEIESVSSNLLLANDNAVYQISLVKDILKETTGYIGSFFKKDVEFSYWNSKLGNKKPIKINLYDLNKMIKNWLPQKPLKVITHGWLASEYNEMGGVVEIRKAYVDVGDYNVITVDWSKESKTLNYLKSAHWTKTVGERTAQLLENIVKLKVIEPSDVHVIGHSLGAHIAGACGDAFKLGKIGRITGLDPAGPSFNGQLLHFRRLDRNDAVFVDVIHTDATLFGYPTSLGTVDFYPNEIDEAQPGCSSFFSLYRHTCSHLRSHQFYAESVYNNASFLSVKCGSFEEYKRGSCKNNEKSHMGHNVDPKTRGDFYLATYSKRPFSFAVETIAI